MFEKLSDYFSLRLYLWLLEFIDDEVLETGNAVFAYRMGSLEHCLAGRLRFLASCRLPSIIMRSNRSKSLLFSVPAPLKRRQQANSSNARSRCIQELAGQRLCCMQTDSTALIESEVYVQDRFFLSAGENRAAHAYVPCSPFLIR